MVGEDDDLDSVSEFQKERTKEYVQNLHIPDTKPIAIVNTPEKQSPQLSAYANTSTPYVPPNVNNNNSQMELCNLITKMMARKDIVLSRLIKYNDSPFQFLSWKETFKDVMKELSVTPSEELDLLIKWLGPDSARQAESIKAASASDHVGGLHKIWDRLDVRYGSPELIEQCLKTKLANFPKLSNTAKDYERLYELYDILCEIQFVKNNPQYSQVLAYYDSSTGVNQIVNCLPHNLQEKWSTEAIKYKKRHNMLYPPFSFFVYFTYDMAKWRTDPSFQFAPQTNKTSNPASMQSNLRVSTRKTDVYTIDEKQVCPIHGTNHDLNECRAFRQKPMTERMDLLKKNRLCFRCCSLQKHLQRSCRENIHCNICKSSNHPTALHIYQQDQNIDPYNGSQSVNDCESEKIHEGELNNLSHVSAICTKICGNPLSSSKSCAKILPIYVYPKNKTHMAQKVYAIIDDQSTHSLGTSKFFDIFNENAEHINFTLASCSGKVSTMGRVARHYTIEALDHSTSINIPSLIECNDIPNNRDEIPSPEVAASHDHLNNIASHIPPIDQNIKIELLIGRDVIQAHHVLDQRLGGDNLPYAQKLPLGWVIVGESCLGQIHRTETVTVNKTFILPDGRTSHFQPCANAFTVKPEFIFERTPYDETIGPSIEDKLFIELMDSKVKQGSDNRWTAPLPFRKDRPVLPNNRVQAVQRVNSLERSLRMNPNKKEHILEFMNKMFVNKHAEKAPNLPIGNECWYLPFFGVYHPKKPGKVRIVFDSSAKFSGTSLNDVLIKGPDLTNNLLGVLLRFRKEAVAVTADVEQMFYNFKVTDSHRDYLRFVWHENNEVHRPLIDYRMTVHVFGNSPSPSVATYCLRRAVQNADNDIQDFVYNNFYVDDGLMSCPDVESAVDLMKRTQKALVDGGGLRLHKFVSNSKAVLQSFPSEDLSSDLKDLDLGSETPPVQRSLGLSWDISVDQFTFKVSSEKKPYTRRGALSVINSIFDPIGFASPITMNGKLILREMMSESGPANWDEDLPDHLKLRWENWVSSLVHLQNLQIPRRYSDISFLNSTHLEVHVFSDASKDAIASVAYLKLFGENKSEVSFLMGKAKVSPVHGHTIPRLELCAAVLSVEIADTLKEHLKLDSTCFHFYTDSKVVLGYLTNETRRFYVYVSNRVNRIRTSSSPSQWSYISTDLNPADVATRSLNTVDLPSSVYLQGPTFLSQDSDIGKQMYPLVDPNDDKEVRPSVVTNKTDINEEVGLSSRFSRLASWKSLVRAIQFLKAFIRKLHQESPPSRQEVEQFIIKTVQAEAFSNDINAISSVGQLLPTSNLLSLSPVLDKHNILRVGGRIRHAKTVELHLQPIIIPKKHHLAVLLTRHYHELTCHQGRHMTEGALRSGGFWVIGSKRLVSTIIRQCVTCKKLRGQFKVQKMSDLPEDRLTPGPPFTFVGIDTFGPYQIIHRKTRGSSINQKRWAILFTCLVSRAIHIEVIEEMSSASFINAYCRFIAIRGSVQLIRSDRGTNFVGAIQDLGITAEFIEKGTVDIMLSQHGTIWKFNPPHASHFGGSWERMIGLSRRILDCMLIREKNRLTHEILVTLMAEVSAIVNSRPLVSVSTDPDNPEVLSPSMLLTHKKGQDEQTMLQFGTKDMLRSQWKMVQGLADEFWSKWNKEYLHTLQVRKKWELPIKDLNIGDIVLMRDKELPRPQWPMAIVTKVFPSANMKIRKVEIRTIRDDKPSSFIRPIVELIPLVLTDPK
ncbi:uncharacterized protein [Mytilus edulis]|uniref:uncharacterized protein n=1 Tax=Mytilus edulis TaxID=6550 RepID=UPI0039F14534